MTENARSMSVIGQLWGNATNARSPSTSLDETNCVLSDAKDRDLMAVGG